MLDLFLFTLMLDSLYHPVTGNHFSISRQWRIRAFMAAGETFNQGLRHGIRYTPIKIEKSSDLVHYFYIARIHKEK